MDKKPINKVNTPTNDKEEKKESPIGNKNPKVQFWKFRGTGGTSETEKKFINSVKEMFPEIETNTILSNNAVVDILLGTKVIEFYGDFWHANPDLYPDDYVNKSIKQTAAQIRKANKDKERRIQDAGYQIMVIWEKDWTERPSKVLKKVKKYLSDE